MHAMGIEGARRRSHEPTAVQTEHGLGCRSLLDRDKLFHHAYAMMGQDQTRMGQSASGDV